MDTLSTKTRSSDACRYILHALVTIILAFSLLPAQAALRVLACEPEWGALATELGGERIDLAVATTARQDPHRIEARPSLMAQARRADLLVCTGAELEIGWLPLLLRDSGNAAIQPGRPGHFEATAHVALIERPAVLDRAQGDVHAAGNPHVHLDPYRLLAIADALAQRLAQIDPDHAAHYQSRHRDFTERWRAAIARWEAQAAPLRGQPVAVHHKNWSYLAQWLQLDVVFDLEPKPGIEPSVSHLSALLAQMKERPVRMVLKAAYQAPRAGRWLAERSDTRLVDLPFTVGGSAQAQDLFGLYEDTIARLLAALE